MGSDKNNRDHHTHSHTTDRDNHIHSHTTDKNNMKAQHEGALPPPCIVRKDPRVPRGAPPPPQDPSPLQIATGESIPLRGLEGVPGLPGAPQDEAGLTSPGEGNGNPLQCSFLENPRDGRAWWAAVYGVAQSQTRLK